MCIASQPDDLQHPICLRPGPPAHEPRDLDIFEARQVPV